MVRETVQELYGAALRQIGRSEFHKPYPDCIDVNKPYPRGYRVHDFSLFSGEDGQSSMEHIARFTIQCGELANLENFNNLKLRRFPNFSNRNCIFLVCFSPQKFNEPEVCIADLSRVTQKKGESMESFIDKFKNMKNRCKVFLPEIEFVKMAQKGLDFELRKKFQGMEFKDSFELAAKEVEDVILTEIRSAGSCTVPMLKKKPSEPEKKNSPQLPKDMHYTFDMSKIDEVFDFLVKEKFITFPPDHRVPPKEELKGREYCNHHNSYNHATKSCWAFKNILQYRINKGILKFPDKQESMAVDDDLFPPIASINVNVTDLRDLLN
ncbi:uncharacterized protein LOC142532247 [Primulina tabacum]|uniref:uncharacterized protein LOC142532247 n=1 Tax=Primulina tabacum TaxID=48773 RepID=UPI003F595B81